MSYLTDRKRAVGMGSAHSGTHHHWVMTLSSFALAILVPLFIILVAPLIGEDHDTVFNAFSQPFRAVVTALTLLIGFHHLALGMRVMFEDYTQGATRRALILIFSFLCLVAAALGIFALARISI